MSLKGFHIVFMSVCLVLFAFFIVWGFLLAPDKTVLATGIGISGIIGTLLLPVYAGFFFRKTRSMNL